MAQRDRARREAVDQMKAEGIEYEQRVVLVEDVTWPRPLAELLEVAFAAYAPSHPWVLDERLSPKSVVRELFSEAMTFTEYVARYGLARSEGLVLRYLSDAYKALRQTVPEDRRTEALTDLVVWLGELVRQVDSSLLEEWELLSHPETLTSRPGDDGLGAPPPPVTANARAFRVLVRNALFRRVELAARRQWWPLGELDAADGWDADAWVAALEPYFAEHASILTGADARGPALFGIQEEPPRWRVRQIIDDPEGDHDWGISALVDLAASDEAGEAVVHVTAVDRLQGFTRS